MAGKPLRYGLTLAALLWLASCEPVQLQPLGETGTAAPATPPTLSDTETQAVGRQPAATPGADPLPQDSYREWSTVELEFSGPQSQLAGGGPNPFLIDLAVEFLGPEEQSYLVPGFYAGDGHGGQDGGTWRVRFTPDQSGSWRYRTESDAALLDGISGDFEVHPAPACPPYLPGDLPDFQCLGRLIHRGGSYLSFPDGSFWLKGGVDDPEDFLAVGQNAGFPSKEAAIDFLAEQGINSIYIMLNNVGGDGRNVWPWLGENERQAIQQHESFDVLRLDAWEALFRHIQARGIVLHLVLEDDSGWTGFDRPLYYREMVARFGHHNGLIWNLSEEYNENYSAAQVMEFAAMLSELDSYGHPIAVHHAGSTRAWEPFLSDPHISVTSFQTGRQPQNESAVAWAGRVRESGGEKVISYDETGRLATGERELARQIVWSIYLAGGNFELHTAPLRSYRDFADQFDDLSRARWYLEGLPFCQMVPANELVLSGGGYAFALPGEAYVVYLPSGGEVELDLSGTALTYVAEWFDPGSGQLSSEVTIQGGAAVALESPFARDSVVGLRAAEGLSTACR